MNLVNLFSTTYKLKLDKKEGFYSPLGILFSFILCGLSVLAFFAFGIDIIRKEKPNIVNNTIFNLDRNFKIPTNFTSFGFFHKGVATSDFSRYLTLWAKHEDADPAYKKDLITTHINVTKMPLEKCKLEDISPEIAALAVDGPITDRLCWPKKFPTIMRNSYGEANGAFPEVLITICQNSTANNNFCYPEAQILNDFQYMSFNIFFWDSYIDGYDWNDPGKKVVYKFFNNMGSFFFKRIVFNMKMKSFTTDEGWIIQSDREQNYFSLESVDVTFALRDDEELLHIVFSIYRYKDYYKRKYIKIQEVLAYIGGFISLFYNFLSAIYNYFIFPDVLSLFWDKIRNRPEKTLKDERKQFDVIPFNPDLQINKGTPADKVNASCISFSPVLRGPPLNDKFGESSVFFRQKLEFGCCKKLFRKNLSNDKNNLYHYVQELWNSSVSIETLGKLSLSMNRIEMLLDSSDYSSQFEVRQEHLKEKKS